MTISFNIECEDCGKKYRIRYGLGNNYPQLASFQCYDCSKQIETGYNIFRGDRILNGAVIAKEEYDNPEIQVINLHPEIPTKKGTNVKFCNGPVQFLPKKLIMINQKSSNT